MKTALFLAAGYGSRIADMTSDPKCLLPINGKALIDHHFEKISNTGIKNIHMVLGFEAYKIEEHLKNRFPDLNISYSYNNDFRRLGNTYSMKIGLENINTDVVIFDADLIYDQEILSDFIKNAPENAFLVGPASIDDIECAKTMVDENDNVRLLIDKRAVSEEEKKKYSFRGEAIGIMQFSNTSRINILKACELFFKEEANLIKNWEHLFSKYLMDHDVKTYFIDSKNWIEIDNREDYEKAVSLFKGK